MGLPKIVLEIGINHQGSLDKAMRLIDLGIDAAGDYPRELIYFKFQKRNPDVSVPKAEWAKPRKSLLDGRLTDYITYKREIEFGVYEYGILDRYVEDNLGYPNLFVSVWDYDSVGFVARNIPHIPYIKIPSAHLTNDRLIDACLATSIPLILSTGMRDAFVIDHAIEQVPTSYPLTVMSCVSAYPNINSELELGKIKTLHNLYGPWADIGYSNHSPSPWPVCYAMLLGAKMVEIHLCESRSDIGSDQSASLEKPGIELIFREAQRLSVALGSGELRVLDSELEKRKSLRGY